MFTNFWTSLCANKKIFTQKCWLFNNFVVSERLFVFVFARAFAWILDSEGYNGAFVPRRKFISLTLLHKRKMIKENISQNWGDELCASIPDGTIKCIFSVHGHSVILCEWNLYAGVSQYMPECLVFWHKLGKFVWFWFALYVKRKQMTGKSGLSDNTVVVFFVYLCMYAYGVIYIFQLMMMMV
jgi:hypothetical protein